MKQHNTKSAGLLRSRSKSISPIGFIPGKGFILTGLMSLCLFGAGVSQANAEEEIHAHNFTKRLWAKAVEMVGDATNNRTKQLEANIKTYNDNVDSWQKSLDAAEAKKYDTQIAQIQKLTFNGRLPELSELSDKSIEINGQLKNILVASLSEQSSVLDDYKAQLRKINQAYTYRLDKVYIIALVREDEVLLGQLDDAINASNNIVKWTSDLEADYRLLVLKAEHNRL